VDNESKAFAAWLAGRGKARLIRRLQIRAERICAEQVDKTARRLGGVDDGERRALEAMARAIAAQLLHAPIDYAKHTADGDSQIQRIFGLEEP
jgi:glutamyl-tRNA reductase